MLDIFDRAESRDHFCFLIFLAGPIPGIRVFLNIFDRADSRDLKFLTLFVSNEN